MKLKIGVDIDGVLTDYDEFMYEYGKKYFKKDDSEIDRTQIKIKDIFKVSDEEAKEFWTKYAIKYCLGGFLREDMVDALNKLKENGYEIHIITSRVHTTEDGFLGKAFRKMVTYKLEEADLKYDSIHYCPEENSGMAKAEVCKELGIHIMIDDDPENIAELRKQCGVICVDRTYNKDVISNGNVRRISNGNELYNILKETDNTLRGNAHVEKDKFETKYGITRTIGVPLFKSNFHPEIVGAENIPEDGPILLCGNHLHVWDQFPVICATKRVTHWMAKKEYFEGKLAPFFRQTGAICVDRQGDAKKAEREAIHYLKNNGAIGLFPEGTRNRFKKSEYEEFYKLFADGNESFELFSDFMDSKKFRTSEINKIIELYKSGRINKTLMRYTLLNSDGYGLEYLYNCGLISKEEFEDSKLLPFKFGAVNMAKKTGALIVPFSVTGDYTRD